MRRVNWREEWWAPMLLGLALTVVLQPLLTTVFAASDDYVFLLKVLNGQSVVPIVMGDGRPVQGLVYDVVGRALVHSVADLWIFRVLFLLFSWLACCLIWAQFRTAGWSAAISLCVAMVYGTSVQQVDAAHVTPAGHTAPLSAVLSCAAFIAAQRAMRSHGAARAAAGVGSVLILMVAMSTYQVPVFVWVLLCAAHWLARPQPLGLSLRMMSALVIIPVVASVLYGLVFFVFQVGSDIATVGQRAVLTTRPIIKLIWFIMCPLRDALNLQWMPVRDPFLKACTGQHPPLHLLQLFVSQPATLFSIATGTLMVAGLWLVLRGSRLERLLQLGVALLLLPASCFPNVIIASLYAPLRTQVVLVTLVHFYLLLGARAAWLRWAPRTASPMLPSIMLAAWLVVGLASSHTVARTFVAEPLGCEWSTLLEQVKAVGPVSDIAVIPATLDDAVGPGVRYELGRPASAAPWAPLAMVEVARRQLDLPKATSLRMLKPGSLQTDIAVIQLGCRPAQQ